MSRRSIWLFRHLKHQNQSTGDDFKDSSGIIFLVPFFTTNEVLTPLADDSIVLGRSIWSFRHVECQNLSIISESKVRAGMVQKFKKRNSTSSTVGLGNVICSITFFSDPKWGTKRFYLTIKFFALHMVGT